MYNSKVFKFKERRRGRDRDRQRDKLLQYVTFDVGVFNIPEIAN